MRGKSKLKVVSSGRLTGAVKGSEASSHPGAASRPEPAYSLYSTDSEDQVSTLHKGLDRCAALLHGMLQADKAASPGLPRTVSSRAVKSRLSTSVGKKALKKLPPKADHRSASSGQCGPGARTPREHCSTPPVPHSGVKLHPPQKQCVAQLQSHLHPAHNQTPELLSFTAHPTQTSTLPPHPKASVLLSVRQSSSLSKQLPVHQADCQSVSQPSHTHCVCDEEECIPVRDMNTQGPATDTHTAWTRLEPGQDETVPGDAVSSAEAETKANMVQYLLGELKTLIAGQGSVAERLLSHLEQTVSTPSSHIQSVSDPSALHIQNTQLHKYVKILNEQLKGSKKVERHQKREMLSNAEALRLQEELTAAQHQLQELRQDLTDLQDALRDAQSQLKEREAENAFMKTDLEDTKSRLLDSEQERSKLASLAEQRLKEIGHLNSLLQSRHSLDSLAVAESSVSDTSQHQHQHRLDPRAPPTEHIIQYLKSLGKSVHTECVQYVDAEREGMPNSHLDATAQRSEEPAGTPVNHWKSNPEQPGAAVQRPEEAHRQLSHCDTESVWSDWSMKSGLTFDTRDEAVFRHGLAVLDASIASLQKTIQLDLKS